MKLPAILKGGQDVVLDTMFYIYFFEQDAQYGPACKFLMQQIADGVFSGIITPITTAELLVKPLRMGRNDLADCYRDALRSLPNSRLVDLSPEAGFMAGALRAKYGLPLPDMLQVAIAMESDSRVLITNDKAMQRIKEINIVLLSALI
jgi:predicted nucleic acid-binding protein